MRYFTAITLTNKEIITDNTITAAIGVISFVFFTAFGAHVYIPLGFTPVPLTLQTFFVLLSGAILGKKLGMLSQAIYVGLGALGAPLLFAGNFGFSYILGPTGGYLLGFIAASYIIGRLCSGNSSFLAILIALVIGEAIILGLGSAWLWLGLRFSAKQAFYLGIVPFIPGDIIKLLAAASFSKMYIARARTLFT